MVTIHADPVPLEAWPDGSIRVGGTRLLFELVVEAHEQGLAPREILAAYPVVPLEDIHGALAYYLRHKSEVEAYLLGRQRAAEEVRTAIEADPANAALRQRLRSLRDSAS